MGQKGDSKHKSLLFRMFSDSKKRSESSKVSEQRQEEEIVQEPSEDTLPESGVVAKSQGSIMEQLQEMSSKGFDAVAYYNEIIKEEAGEVVEITLAPDILDDDGQPIPQDGFVTVDLTPDFMQAYLTAFPPQNGGEEATMTQVMEALDAAKVKNGLHEDLLEEMKKQMPPYGRKVLVASGVQKEDGTDASIVELFERKQEIAPQEKSDGTVDFKQLNIMREIKAETPICEIVPETKGTDGFTVTGDVLKAKPGKTVKFLRGNNTEITEDGLKLIASVDGNLSFMNDRFNVENAFIVEGSVDNNTGNINFRGDVTVKGDVREGYEIRCGGSLRVVGTVEGASVYAENGNIVMEGGFNGMRRGEAIAKSGNITSKFLQNCTVYAKGIITTEAIINSVVNCDSQIVATKGKGAIVGGSITALSTIEANVIGSDANTPTSIVVGISPTIIARRNELEKNIKDLENSKEELRKNLIYLERCAKMGPLSEKNAALMESCNKQKVLNLVREGQYTRQLQQVTGAIEEAVASSWVKSKVVYPSTKVTVQNSSYMTKTEHQRVLFRKDEGEIKAGTY